MKEPNFFIIGAPKCGTTSMARWLSLHPEVFMSPVKEPHHFSDDFPLGIGCDWEEYLSLFEKADPRHNAVGEASVWYLRSHEAVPRIEAAIPDARYIVMLRNPVEMAPSLHWQVLFAGDEIVKSFQKAWELQDKREAGFCIPRPARAEGVVQYRAACKLGEQLSRLYEKVGRERVVTVFLEDVERDARREWARVLTSLGLSQWAGLEFYPENRATQWRWPWVRTLSRLYSRSLKRINLSPLGWGVFDRLQRAATEEVKWEPLSYEMRRELVESFSDDIDLLAQLTGRDLSHWKAV